MNTPPELIEMLITDPLGGTKTAEAEAESSASTETEEAEAGPSAKKARPSTPPRDAEDLTDRQFTPRFNSFLKQVPSTLHSVGKPGFFSYFFLGSACALKDSALWEELKKVFKDNLSFYLSFIDPCPSEFIKALLEKAVTILPI